jgi:hypothetical protein
MNKAETLKKCWALLEAEYGGQTEYKKEVWVTMLKKYPSEAIMNATIKYMSTSRFFPFTSDIIKLIEGSKEDEIELVWYKLKSDSSKYGYYDYPLEEESVLGQTINAIGWERLYYMEISEEKWLHREFVSLYRILSNRKEGDYKGIENKELKNRRLENKEKEIEGSEPR